MHIPADGDVHPGQTGLSPVETVLSPVPKICWQRSVGHYFQPDCHVTCSFCTSRTGKREALTDRLKISYTRLRQRRTAARYVPRTADTQTQLYRYGSTARHRCTHHTVVAELVLTQRYSSQPATLKKADGLPAISPVNLDHQPAPRT